MKLKNEIYRVLLSMFCCVSFAGFTIAAQQESLDDEVYYRSGKKLTLSKSGTFQNTDNDLISLKSGFWYISNDTLYLSNVDDSEASEWSVKSYFITYQSDNKLTLTGEHSRFSYHDYESTFKQPGFPFVSVFNRL